ncbi:hypothetical protein ZWY2020_003328 [Hordeum vulgare]|nr:hypothetical protein ZWY2020_003328 [Hordeum vulgare]
MVDDDNASGFTGGARGRKASTRSQTTLRIDPARAFNISVRMETCTLTAAGTEGEETGFTFPIVVDNNSTFEQFRATIFAKYPWGLYDAVELRYRDVSKVDWVPVQSDNELAFGEDEHWGSENGEEPTLQVAAVEEDDGTDAEDSPQEPPQASVLSPRKNYKKETVRGASPAKKQTTTIEVPGVLVPNPTKNMRSKSRLAPNPAENTKSKKLKF